MKSLIKNALILFVITLVAGAALGFVYNITKEPIEEAARKAEEAAYKEAFPDGAVFEDLSEQGRMPEYTNTDEKYKNINIDKTVLVKDSGNEILGYILIVTTSEGYKNNTITMSVGITTDRILRGITFLKLTETAGLGMRAEEVIKPQFVNGTATEYTVTKLPKTDDSQIEAISGATITSKGVTNAVNACLSYFDEALGGGTYQ